MSKVVFFFQTKSMESLPVLAKTVKEEKDADVMQHTPSFQLEETPCIELVKSEWYG
jgi:hypothetical protein